MGEFHSITPSAVSTSDNSSTGQSGGGGGLMSNQSNKTWADVMEELDDPSTTNTSELQMLRAKLPTAPKSALSSDLNLENVPKVKPFRAFIGNISFEADEEKVKSFFKDLKVITVHLATDQGGRSKGSGYIDFDDRESLIAALNKHESVFINRQIRISLQDNSRGGFDRTGGYGERREGGGGYGGNRQQTPNDGAALRSDEASWRRTEPEPVQVESSSSYGQYSEQQQSRYNSNRYQSGGGSGGYQQQNQQQRRYNNQSGGGGGYSDRRNNNRNDGSDGQQRRQYSGGYQQQQQNKQYGSESRSSYGEVNPSVNNDHHLGGDHDQQKTTQSPVAVNTPPQIVSPTTSMSEVKERPKLNLIPRTLPVDENTAVNVAAASSSIFGGAKPVNTAAREREIEERLKRERAAEKERQAAAAAAADSTSPTSTGVSVVTGDASQQQQQHHHQ